MSARVERTMVSRRLALNEEHEVVREAVTCTVMVVRDPGDFVIDIWRGQTKKRFSVVTQTIQFDRDDDAVNVTWGGRYGTTRGWSEMVSRRFGREGAQWDDIRELVIAHRDAAFRALTS